MDSFFSKKSCFRKASATGILALATLIIGSATLPNPAAFAQATNTSGSIQGTITDASGAALAGAKIVIVSTTSGTTKTVTADSAGAYNSGPLVPGDYKISITAPGFSQLHSTALVQISTVSPGNFRMAVGAAAEVVEVEGNAVVVNTEQTNIQSVVTPQQVQNLPMQGRNFLDLAQLEPGVVLQSGETFDPTKAGYSALSIGGVSGRTTRILLDGSDITDETVGTTIFNVPSGAIGEFEMTRSTADVSGDITSSGSVFATTPSGTNAYHGQLFYNFQNNTAGFANSVGGINPPFERNQFGGNIGGPVLPKLKDKLFFFGDLERIKQDSGQAIQLSSQFAGIQQQFPTYQSPFRDTYSTIRLDYNGPWGVHYFARANYEVNSVASTFGYGYALYANRDNTPGIAGGADFVTGKFTHSFRGGYEKFHNLISNATGPGSGLYDPIPGIFLDVPGTSLFSGPNLLAPQQTYQSEKQFRYDGSWTKGAHTIRYGASVNRILGGGFASFYGLGPEVATNTSPVAGLDPGNPVNYAPAVVVLGNGEGYDTEVPQFNAPSGGQGDWRTAVYAGDTWKVIPTLTLNFGLRWQRDTGRSDSDLAPIPCSQISTSFFPNPPCSGNQNILDQFGAGLGNRVRQPNENFGPQFGFAYAPGIYNGKTVIRGGIGLYYENFVFNNVLFDRPFKLAKGLFFGTAEICGGTNSFTLPDGTTVNSYNGTPISTLCSEPVSQSGAAFAAIEKQYQAATIAAGAASNGGFIGNTLAVPAAEGYDAYAPNTFAAPRSIHINIGVQQQISQGMVISADYLHQVTYKFMQAIDVNHVGDARFFDKTSAQEAVTNTLAACGSASVAAAISQCPGLHTNSDGSIGGATIYDFAGNGLDSGVALNSGFPNRGAYANPNLPTNFAFPGQNPEVGQGLFQYPSGRSGYDALQIQLREQKAHPLPGLADSNLTVSYNFSRFVSTASGSTASDQFFTAGTWDYNDTNRFVGPGNLDQTHQLSFGGYATIAHGPTVGLTGHFSSAPPTNLTLDNSSGETGSIYTTNTTGDGQIASGSNLLPDQNPGAYMRSVKSGAGLSKVISAYNSRYAGTATPAGQTLLTNGIFSSAELSALGGVQQQIAPPTGTPLANGDFKEIDANVAYPFHLRFLGEATSIVPVVAFYNVANFANYSGPSGQLLNVADAAGNTSNLNTASNFGDRQAFKTQRGSGTFNQGGPRTLEFQLKLNF